MICIRDANDMNPFLSVGTLEHIIERLEITIIAYRQCFKFMEYLDLALFCSELNCVSTRSDHTTSSEGVWTVQLYSTATMRCEN